MEQSWRLHFTAIRSGTTMQSIATRPLLSQQSPLRKLPGCALGVRAAASAAAGSAAEDLVAWVQRSGGSVSGVEVQQLPGGDAGGYGLSASAACPRGARLISLPQACHLTYGGPATDPRLLALIEQVPAELWGAKLALALLAQRLAGGASPFAAYIAALPVGVQGLPMFFPGDALAALQYPPVTEQVKRRCRWLLGFSQGVLAALPDTAADPFGSTPVDANALGWALGVVTSRAFRTRGPGQPAAMLPLIDMANHSFSPNARVLPAGQGGGGMCLVATRDLEAGEPVLISYGDLSNDFLLMDYGFLIPDNPHDTVQLRFDPGLIEAAKAVAGVKSAGLAGEGDKGGPPALPAWQHKALVALQLAGEQANPEVSIRWAPEATGGAPLDARLLAGARVLCAANAAELGGRSGVEQLGQWEQPLSAAGEAAALRTLTGLCAIALSQFQGSLEDDAALLQQQRPQQQVPASQQGQQQQQGQQGGPLSAELELAVRFRMEKKRLILSAINRLTARIKELAAGGSRSSASASPAAAAAPAGPGSGSGSSRSGGSSRGFGTSTGRAKVAGMKKGGGKGFGA